MSRDRLLFNYSTTEGLLSGSCGNLHKFAGPWLEKDGWMPSRCLVHVYREREVELCLNHSSPDAIAEAYVVMTTLSSITSYTLSPTNYRTLFLNVLCNHLLLPEDATCCMDRDTRSFGVKFLLQTSLLFGSIVGLLFLLLLCIFKLYFLYDKTLSEGIPSLMKKILPFTKDFIQLWLIISFVYFADRSDLFYILPKNFFSWTFFPFLFCVVCCLGPFWSSTLSPGVLNRSQTEEMKGWMQVVILLYHYTGMSSTVPVYAAIHLLVAGYLFLSGFGHFMYFWRTGDFSICRVFRVLIRYNLATVVLSVVMGLAYVKYYFVPLISAWFVFGYVVMATWPQITEARVKENQKWNFLLIAFCLKLFLMFILVECLVSNEGRFAQVFSYLPFHSMFADSNGSLREWWFRVQLDRHAFLWGIVVAFILSWWRSRQSVVPRADYEDPRLQSVVAGVCILVILLYLFAVTRYEDKQISNSSHVRWSILPILAFVILRNINPTLQRHFNIPFWFIGRITLELFLCQYHIWLSKDTHGLLLYGFTSDIYLNFLISTFLFVFISHRLHLIQHNLLSFVL